jgi:hypothetical protein
MTREITLQGASKFTHSRNIKRMKSKKNIRQVGQVLNLGEMRNA